MGKIIEREANLKDALVELDIIIDIIENYRDTLEKINRKMKIENILLNFFYSMLMEYTKLEIKFWGLLHIFINEIPFIILMKIKGKKISINMETNLSFIPTDKKEFIFLIGKNIIKERFKKKKLNFLILLFLNIL